MKHPTLIIFFLCLLLGIHTAGNAKMRPILKHRVGTPPHEVLQKILETNLSPPSQATPANTKMTNQSPYITWLADSDSRVEPRFILPTNSGNIYSVRNLANQLLISQGAVDYGVRYLHTPVLLITGNSASEAISLLITDHNALPTAIQADLDHLFSPYRDAVQEKIDEKLSLSQKVQMIVEKNIDYQVDKAMDLYQDRVSDGRLVVIGAVLDISNHYNKGVNRLLIININGEKRDDTLQHMPFTDNLRPELKKSLGRKPALH